MNILSVWRICHKKYLNNAFSGEGARLYGGRFNSEGTSAVYTAGHLSLALLEMLVQTNDRAYFEKCIIFEVKIPEVLIFEPATKQLPPGWNRIPYGKESQHFGDQWIQNQEKPVLKVPSVVVPVEYNYIINPNHPHYNRIGIARSERAPYDPRLFDVIPS